MRREGVEFPFIDLKEYKMEETQNTLRETLAEAIDWYQTNLKSGDTVLFLNDLPETYSS